MALKQYSSFRLNFIPEGPPPKVRVHQYDIGSVISLRGILFYGNEEVGSSDSWITATLSSGTVKVSFIRGDYKKYTYTLSGGSYTDGYFQFPLDKKMTWAAGPCSMSIGFQRSTSQILWTQNFILDVEPAPVLDTDLSRIGTDSTLQEVIDTAVENAYSTAITENFDIDGEDLAIDSDGFLYFDV